MTANTLTHPSEEKGFHLELPAFEGPLDLLLHLIQKHELDILDLPIAFVSRKYLEYLEMMKQLDLDVASDYLVMAAELARIKSKTLLPAAPDEEGEEPEEEIDPRAELIRSLLEYQKYRHAAADLGERGLVGRDVFARAVAPPEETGPAPLREVSVFKLLDAFQSVLSRGRAELALEVSSERMTIQERITQLIDELGSRERRSFDSLFASAVSVQDLVLSFMAILEMAKMGMLHVHQDDPKSILYLEYRVEQVEPIEAKAPIDQGTVAQENVDQGTVEQEAASLTREEERASKKES